jgi:4'-phosphopantetheinyl transferase
MPIIFEKQINAAKKLAVWQITESLDFFLAQLGQMANPQATTKRQLENAVCCVLLNTLGGKNLHLKLDKDVYGKPFIHDHDIAVTFSHSKEMVACMIDVSNQAVGIDVEKKRESILSISKKFINSEDTTPFDEVLHCHLVWGAKEVLYKIHSKKELDFIRHLTVKFQEKYEGFIHKNEVHASYSLDFKELSNFILVWNI